MYPELKGDDGPETKEASRATRGRPRCRLKVNAKYPRRAPLPTVPPNLLARLPQLPEDVEYRIVGKDLILRDVDANIIVDFIRTPFGSGGLSCTVIVTIADVRACGFATLQLMPNKETDSVKFAVIGDTGTGDQHQRDVAKQLATTRRSFRSSSRSCWATTSTAARPPTTAEVRGAV